MRRPLEAPSAARLVIALTWQEELIFWDKFVSDLERVFGRITAKCDEFDFSQYTAYYEREMGPGLKKCFVEFAGVYQRDSLPDLKKKAFELEGRFLKNEMRLVNVDPMLVSIENVVISTSKNFTHRVYLRDGVFGDLALLWTHNKFEPLPWTYPDYADHLKFFREVRTRLHAELKAMAPSVSGDA